MKQVISQKEIGRRIRQVRKERNMKAVDVARKLGVSRQHIYFLEGGKKGLTVERLQQLATLFKVDAEYFIGRHKKSA